MNTPPEKSICPKCGQPVALKELRFWIMSFLVLFLVSCMGLVLIYKLISVPSDKLQTGHREVGSFSSIEASVPFNVEVIDGSQTSVTVVADANILPHIETNVVGEVLIISTHGSGSYFIPDGVKVQISAPDLVAFSNSGSGDTQVSKVKVPKFDLRQDGSGNIKLQGVVDTLNIYLTGSGNVDASELICQDAEVTIAGSGDIRYLGNPQHVERQIFGAGRIEGR